MTFNQTKPMDKNGAGYLCAKLCRYSQLWNSYDGWRHFGWMAKLPTKMRLLFDKGHLLAWPPTWGTSNEWSKIKCTSSSEICLFFSPLILRTLARGQWHCFGRGFQDNDRGGAAIKRVKPHHVSTWVAFRFIQMNWVLVHIGSNLTFSKVTAPVMTR